jgi:membrane protease subunit (stomatin/prohibitin family)
MNEGKIADVFPPGMYTLTTQNMPILTTLKGWVYGFNSPFKVDVFFVSTRQFVNQKWGTMNPVMMRDAEFGPVRLRAFGSFAFRVKDAGVFLKEISATNPDFTVESITTQLRNLAVSRGMEAIAEAKIPVLDIASQYEEVSTVITGKIKSEFEELGLELTKFLIENVSLPPEVEAALDKRSSIGIVGNLNAYTQFQIANSLEKSAENPGGGGTVGAGVGAGIGLGIAGQIAGMMQNNQAGNSNMPPPLQTEFFVAIDGKQAGPFSQEQLMQLVSNNSLQPQTLVWKKGMNGWAAANTLPELASLLNSAPPPLPGN